MTNVINEEYIVESPANTFETVSASTLSFSCTCTHNSVTNDNPEATGSFRRDDLHFRSNGSGDGISGDSGQWTTSDEECEKPAMEFLARKVELLKQKKLEEESVSGAALSQHTKTAAAYEMHDDETHGRETHGGDTNPTAEHSFCKECIRRLESGGKLATSLGSAGLECEDQKETGMEREKSVQLSVRRTQLEEPVAVAAIGRRQLERLKFEAMKCKMRTQVEHLSASHSVENCLFCKQKQQEVARSDFIQRKTHQLSKSTFTAQLEQHLYFRDSATLLAEVVNSCIRPSASSEEVWEELRNRMDALQK